MSLLKLDLNQHFVLLITPLVNGYSSEIDFVRDVKPILEHNCVSCHREDNDKGDIRLEQKQQP